MRILLQQKQTGLYFQGPDAWVRDSVEAADFLSSTAAIDFCAQQRLGNVQLVLKFDREKHEIVLPVQAGEPVVARARPGLH